jgi:hypothetical protein
LVSPESFVKSALLAALASSGVGASTTARISFSRSNACSNWIVALAPVEVGRNQLVDVGVDGEMPGRIVARSDRQKQGDDDDESGKRVHVLTIETNRAGQHSFLSKSKGAGENARCLAEFPQRSNVVWLLPRRPARAPKRAEMA